MKEFPPGGGVVFVHEFRRVVCLMQIRQLVLFALLLFAASASRAGEPAPLPANPLPERMNFPGALRITLPIGGGNKAALDRMPLFAATRGRTVVMALDNRDTAAHVVHLHGYHFRLLDRLDDGWKPYWLDTVLVEPRQTERIAFVADMPGKWAIDARAMDRTADVIAWFEVT